MQDEILLNLKNGFEKPKDEEIERQLKRLMTTSYKEAIKLFLFDWLSIACLSTLSWQMIKIYGINFNTIVVYLICTFLIATRQRALECLIHEATHFNLSSNMKLNDTLCWLFAALPLGHNLITERIDHVQGHHKRFWQYEYDPDYRRYTDIGINDLPADSFLHLIKILIDGFGTYFKGALRAFFLPLNESTNSRIKRFILMFLFVVVLYLYDYLIQFILFWLFPMVTFLSIIRYIGEVCEHGALPCINEFSSTRNNLGVINEWFIHPHGDGYHLVHHLYPKIPFYHAKKAHELLMSNHVYANHGQHLNSFFSFSNNEKTSIGVLFKKKH